MGQGERPKSFGGLRVLIAGGGVAGLEALLALRELAGDLVDVELLSPEPHFWYRPTSVIEPFGHTTAHRFELPGLAAAAGATFTPGQLASVDPDGHVACTTQGVILRFDVLVIATGTKAVPAVPGALAFRGPSDVDAFRGLLDEIEAGTAVEIAFALPRRTGLPLPLYELALQTAAHVDEHGLDDVELTFVTHEPGPLAVLGPEVVETLAALLTEQGVSVHTGCYPVSFADRRLELLPAGALVADRVVTLPRLQGQTIAGIPHDADGFVATDRQGRVDAFEDIYAAGDVTRFPIKQGGIATQQADLVAEAIAASAGADVRPGVFEPVLHAVLVTGRAPLYIRADLRAGQGEGCTVSPDPLRWPAAKIAGRYLSPFLARHRSLEPASR